MMLPIEEEDLIIPTETHLDPAGPEFERAVVEARTQESEKERQIAIFRESQDLTKPFHPSSPAAQRFVQQHGSTYGGRLIEQKPPTPPRHDRGAVVGFAGEIAEHDIRRAEYEPSPSMYVAHKPEESRERMLSVSAHDYAGGDQPARSAEDPLMGAEPRRRPGGQGGQGGTAPFSSPRKTKQEGSGGDRDPERREEAGPQKWGTRMYGGGSSQEEEEYGRGTTQEDEGPDDRKRRRRLKSYRRAQGRRYRELQGQTGLTGTQVIHTPQPAIIPVMPQVVSGVAARGAEKPGINIKINTKSQAIINEKKKKRKVTTARKEYSKLRRETIKAIRKGRAEHYKAESAKLKSLPVKKRKAARDTLKKKLREREVKLVGQLPGASKMALKDLDRVSRIARKLRW